MRTHLHQQERLDRAAELRRVQTQFVAQDQTAPPQSRHPVQAGRRGESHGGGEIAVRRPGIVLKEPQNLQIDRI
ncbi:hypothetical protein GCM10023347_20410 [Streptomyces chumphonensis]